MALHFLLFVGATNDLLHHIPHVRGDLDKGVKLASAKDGLAAIQKNDLPGHPAGVVAHEISCQIGQLLRIPEPVRWELVDGLLSEFPGGVQPGEGALRFNRAGGDRVESEAVPSPLSCKGSCQVVHARLGCRRRTHKATAVRSIGGRDGEEVGPLLGGDEPLANLKGDPSRAVEHRVNDGHPGIRRQPLRRRNEVAGSVVDHNVR
mmetsp:Transcript_9772/g.25105  ORF Transcript_9772/g.25105 Transcript_9772/m.25105 type:complete len:205 (+) Transcript_9772:1161-1775(+)